MQLVAWFVWLAFWHFPIDWLFQTEADAIAKSTDKKVRSRHCLHYALAMDAVAVVGQYVFYGVWNHGWHPIAFGVWVYVSHSLEDTYLPVLWWAQRIRKIPEMQRPPPGGLQAAVQETLKRPINLILFIVVDQIFHLLTLWPAAWLASH